MNNFGKRGPPLAFLLLALVVALATVGVGYTLWNKTLTISGTVDTGDLDAVWTVTTSGDPQGANDPGYTKDVGQLICEIDGSDPQIAHFTVLNGYPSYTADCEVHYNNTGTIPWVVESIDFTAGQNLTGCTVVQDPGTGSFSADCDQLTVTYVDGLCTQIDPGNLFGIASSVVVHVKQQAQESTPYGFDIGIVLVQWNESQCP